MKDRYRPSWAREYRHHYHHSFRYHPPIWQKSKERFVVRRFFGPIMGVLFMVVLGFLAVTILINELPGTKVVMIVGGTVFVLLLLAAISYIGHAVKTASKPFVEVMSAADMVAKGDLSVRVSEDFPGEFKKMAKSFNRMVAELEGAEDRRRRLTADVAHELRTPLHILQGNLEGMQDGIYPKDDEQIKILLEEIRILSRLVDDLQTLTLAENKQLHLDISDVNVDDLLSETAAGFASQAESLDVELCVLSSLGQTTIGGDHERLGQVLRNLIANSLRFTPPGGKITISSALEGDHLLIQISDTGAGIPEEDLTYVFDRFWKGDQSRIRQSGVGSGLGLSIAKGIIEMHQGEISVDSIHDQGTTFSIRLPITENI